MRPMNSLIILRWNQGGRNVSSPTSQRGGKMTKSQFAIPGIALGLVRTVKILGSGWSKLIVPMVLNRLRSYLYGTRLPCKATTDNGERSEKRRVGKECVRACRSRGSTYN